MNRLWTFLTDSRTLTFLGLLFASTFLFLCAIVLKISLVWAVIGTLLIVAIWFGVWFYHRRRARRAADDIGDMLEQQAAQANKKVAPEKRAEVAALRKRMVEAIHTIRTSKLGQVSGNAALYDLPWYIVIGNPAAGKSSAVVNSGLQFPFADNTGNIIQGIGGTRNCDWFFTSEGILLDTAGRYAVHEEDREEWFGFLGLLKKHRAKAPINGIIIAASLSELAGNRPEYAITLAKQLRQRLQEVTNKLEVFAPVYVVFTKVDLITGFAEFFQGADAAERERVWGASLPYDADGKADAVTRFDEHFDILYDGLKELSVTRMSMSRGTRLPPGVLAFPLEFTSIKPALRSFIATLFEENPFQFKPVFRGFYFTSAIQEGRSTESSSGRVADRFGLKLNNPLAGASVASSTGFFLRELFSQVIFADRNLVKQHASRAKLQLRYIIFFAAITVFGVALGAWTWSYMGNRQLLTNVQADLSKVTRLQENKIDLQSRLEALAILQDRMEQLQRYRDDRPLGLGLGLYQGEPIEKKLRAEYFAGVREVMLNPVAATLEAFLAEVNASTNQITAMAHRSSSTTPSLTGEYKEASPANAEDAYNALKTYLMLASAERIEPSHLTDQITRFWRGWLDMNRGNMSRDEMISSAERIISFYVSQAGSSDLPLIENKLTLIEQARETLRTVTRGMPAVSRVYSDIKARASTRFPSMTVARILGEDSQGVIAGSYAIPGTFTRNAWEQYVQPAITEAANNELQSNDWVLKTAARDDLTLDGSPEQIQKALTQMYKEEYVREWQKFLQGVTIPEFENFEQAVAKMNLLGDPVNSPINKLMSTLYQETSWDNPSLINQGLQKAQSGFIAWFRETILRQAPTQVKIDVNTAKTANTPMPLGPIGKEFAPIAQLIVSRGDNKDASLMKGYLATLSKTRARFNQIKNQGDAGPATLQFMQQTLNGEGSELADALRYVDEQMLTGMNEKARDSIRPLLVRPLMQSYAVIVGPAALEINKNWHAQVYAPFNQSLADKYPFATNSRIEAAAAEIGQIFGPGGAIAKFAQTTMGTLVVRRGDEFTPRTWADIGLTFNPEFTGNFARWVAAPGAGGAAAAGAEGATASQTLFQIQPLPASGLAEYTVEIDGQILRYRNTKASWTSFVWPNPQGQPGARITGVTYDGKSIEMVNHPGRLGLERLISTAQRKKKDSGTFELSWIQGATTVAIDLRIVSSPGTAMTSGVSGESTPQGSNLRGLRLPATIVSATTTGTERAQ